MQIKNNFKALDKAHKDIEIQIEQLKKAFSLLQKELESLSSKGWQDKNYVNLKNVMSQQQVNLQQTVKGIEQLRLDLQNRSKLIKSYYSINF